MRVISGRLRGRNLFAPKGHNIRPTSDQVKESLFNIIGSRVLHATFLDLFAGTGNIGIEALSRHAARVVFVEKSPEHVRVIKRNLAVCQLESESRVYCGDANNMLRVLQKAAWTFDIIFVDPPYRQTNMLRDILTHIVERSLLADTGLLVVEHANTFIPQPNIGETLFLSKNRRIGDTTLSFYQFVDEN